MIFNIILDNVLKCLSLPHIYLIVSNCIYFVQTNLNKICLKVSGYDHEMPQSHIADQPWYHHKEEVKRDKWHQEGQ